MMSRTQLRWQAPTENVDGTPIDYPLDYELGIAAVPGAELIVALTVVGTLQPDGSYLAPLEEMPALETPGSYELGLRAINREAPLASSDWSNRIALEVTADTPRPPVLMDV